MVKSMQRRWTARSLLISILACLAGLCLVFACLTVPRTASGQTEERDPVATIYLGQGGVDEPQNNIYYYDDFVSGWQDVVERSRAAYRLDSEDFVRAILRKDWVASSRNGFGTAAGYFSEGGGLLLPAGTNIEIDLSGCDIDRNLNLPLSGGTSQGRANGYVMRVEGKLTVKDSSSGQTGSIRGGYNVSEGAVYGGGVQVDGGTFDMYGGTIEDNCAEGTNVYGVGVSVVEGGTFNLYGGTVRDHSAVLLKNSNNKYGVSYGAGVCVVGTGRFSMHGGVVEGNEAVYGGGVASYYAEGTAINIDGGDIRSNRAINHAYEVETDPETDEVEEVTSLTMAQGGGVCVYGYGDAVIAGGKISYNTSMAYGGGVAAVGKQGTTNLTIRGGTIDHNAAYSLTNDVHGGGVAVMRHEDTKSATDVSVNAVMSGGSVEYNLALNCERSGRNTTFAEGGGVYVACASFTLTGGYILGNRVCSLNEASANEARLETVVNTLLSRNNNSNSVSNDVSDGSKTYGGGVAVFYYDNNDGYTLPAGSFIMNGGFVNNNRATTGGGIYVDGELVMSGGSVSTNYGVAGGGLYLGTVASVKLSGRPVVQDNYSTVGGGGEGYPASNLHIAAIDGGADANKLVLEIVGAFSEGARIHISVDDALIESGKAITKGYGDYNGEFVSVDGNTPDNETDPTNGKYVYDNPYRYFVSDTVYDAAGMAGTTSKQHIMVLTSGELAVARNAVRFDVTYSTPSTPDGAFIFGEGNLPAQNYLEWTYSDDNSEHPLSVTENGNETNKVDIQKNGQYAAGVYTIFATLSSDAKVEFSVIVKAKDLSEDELVYLPPLDDGECSYSGEEQRPTFMGEITYNSTPLDVDTHYTLSYENATNAGNDTAVLIISFIGNYTGERRVTYSIHTNTDERFETEVKWEIYVGDEAENDDNGDGWVDFTDEMYNGTFTYDGTDQSYLFRAILTVYEHLEEEGDPVNRNLKETKTVYADSFKGVDAERNTNLWLTFNGSREFVDVDEYSISIGGEPNYTVAHKSISGIVMGQMSLDLSEDDFTYTDADDQHLWLVQFVIDGRTYTSNLLDVVTYVENSAIPNIDERVRTEGEEGVYYYARYRGTELSLVLNGAYKLANGLTVAQILAMSGDYYYNPSNGEVGSTDGVTPLTASVTINFGNNYAVSGGSMITLTKDWAIVALGNHMRMADGSEITSTGLNGWDYGSWDNLQGYAFRPEHGNTVIYTYYNEYGEVINQFALVYEGDTTGATKRFYEAVTSGGQLVANTNRPLTNDVNYLYTYNNTLQAGSYRIELRVPMTDGDVDTHMHWWDGSEGDDETGTVFYGFTYNFSFTVRRYDISGGERAGVRPTFSETTVEYNGKPNNLVKPVLMLNRKLLVEGVDYTLSCEEVNVGSANLIVTGMGSLTGSYTIANAFEIVQARNGWLEVPYIMQWTYRGFSKDVNKIGAKPELLDDASGLWFAISRTEDGRGLISGLDHIVLEDGLVPDSAVEGFNALKAGQYYLVAHVEEVDNYEGLNPSPIPFTVFKATNSWEVTPTVNAWIEGRYEEETDRIQAKAVFGEVHVRIEDDNGNVYYDSEEGIDRLADAKVGRYTLTASVSAADDYSGLDVYTFIFNVFKKPGLPWWVTLVVTVGALALVALIIFILWKKGVFQILTEKIVVAIRTRASVEATIASVRAAKMMEEGKQSIEEAKRRERLEKMRQKAQEQRNLSPEERAAMLAERAAQHEAKAQAEAERAEKMRVRAENALARAEKQRKSEGDSTDDAPETPETPETPADE